MKIEYLKPLPEFVIVRCVPEEEATISGIIVGEQNLDEFLMQGVITQSKNEAFPIGESIFFHVLNAEAIHSLETNVQYFLIPVNHIRGFYEA